MCNPIIAAVAVAAAVETVSVIGQNQAASATNRALNEQNAVRKKQIDQAATQEVNERLRAMRREQSRIQVAAGQAGLSLGSGSLEALLMDSAQQAEIANDTSIANRESRKAASDAETQANMQSKTTALGAGLRIGLSAASAGIGASRKGK